MKKIVLFDLDGTLTPPRGKMQHEIINSLARIQKTGVEVGIVTGSDLNYLEEQCDAMLDIGPVDITKIHFLPCNGTKYYDFENNFRLIKSVDMIEKIGKDTYREIIKECMTMQLDLFESHKQLEYTGNYLDYRGSVLNWCPIGRSANPTQRKLFIDADNTFHIRNRCINHLRPNKYFKKVDIVLGGESSFDIYPCGWDKTFALQYFKEYDVYFVGDRCQLNGNDRSIYLQCGQNGYCTTGPQNTIEIIDKILVGIQ
tara:strand:+ start:2710 stop:3477 length:768 start_codon:yes stop_codon:yes gene_type:complete